MTTSSPPARRKPTAHSAVTAGGPKDRATTRSKAPRRCSSRASTSARPHSTETRSPRSRVATARGQELTPTALDVEQHAARVGPPIEEDETGQPPATPEIEHPPVEVTDRERQIARVLVLARHRTGPEQAEPTGLLEDVEEPRRTALGHRDPSAPGRWIRRGAGPRAGGVLALRHRRDAVDLARGVVDDLAVARRHRLERLRPTGLQHLLRERCG